MPSNAGGGRSRNSGNLYSTAMLFSVKLPCEQELPVKQTKKKKERKKKTKKQQKHCDRALDLYHILSLICGLYLKCDTSEVIVVGKEASARW